MLLHLILQQLAEVVVLFLFMDAEINLKTALVTILALPFISCVPLGMLPVSPAL